MRRAVVLALALLLSIPTTDANAQTSVGVHFSALNNEYPNEAVFGAGGSFTHMRGPVGIDASSTLFVPRGLGDFLWQHGFQLAAGVAWKF